MLAKFIRCFLLAYPGLPEYPIRQVDGLID
jgi:hypothetical protein